MGLAYREARLTLKFYFWENNLDHGLLDQLWIPLGPGRLGQFECLPALCGQLGQGHGQLRPTGQFVWMLVCLLECVLGVPSGGQAGEPVGWYAREAVVQV